MKKFTKLAMLIASVALGAPAMASQASTTDNWVSGNAITWKNGTNELCWRNAGWTPATAAAGCDGAIVTAPSSSAAKEVQVPAVKSVAVVTPGIAEPAKFSYEADAFFDFDKSVLKSAGKSKLDELAAKLEHVSLKAVIAVGHADAKGSNEYNQKLSLRRAQAVKDYLVSKGVDKTRIEADGKGELQPIADNKTSEGRSKNRRVAIEVTGTLAHN